MIPMIKKLSQTRRGVATIIGSILSIVILLFFFSNVFLWYNGVSSQMSLVMTEKLNSQIELTTTVLEGNSTYCGDDDPVFGGYDVFPYDQYGENLDPGMSNKTRNKPDGNSQRLRETKDFLSLYLALKATYSFNVTVMEVNKSSALTFGFYGKYLDSNDPTETCKAYLLNYEMTKILGKNTYEDTGITITPIESWYNTTISNPKRFVSSSGVVNVAYMSRLKPYNQTIPIESRGTLYIDSQTVALSPVGLKVRALGSRDVRLLRLWVIRESINDHKSDHNSIDFEQELRREIWVTGGSSMTIKFVENKPSNLSDGIIQLNLLNSPIGYSPVLGEVHFRVLTDLGNTAMATYEA